MMRFISNCLAQAKTRFLPKSWCRINGKEDISGNVRTSIPGLYVVKKWLASTTGGLKNISAPGGLVPWIKISNEAKPLLKNRFVLTGIIFITWMAIFDQNNLIDRVSLSNQIKDMERQKAIYQEQIKSNRLFMEELRSNPENLEKFAREQFLMKKPDEEIFIIVE